MLEDFDITKESLKEDDFESVKQKLKVLACADWRLFMKLLISQGYDLWLTKAFLPTNVPKHIGKRIMNFCTKTLLLKKIKKIIEHDYCD